LAAASREDRIDLEFLRIAARPSGTLGELGRYLPSLESPDLMEWIKIPSRAAWRLVMVDEGLELSGYIAFTAFLSLFPFLIFLAALAGFLGDRETADEFIDAMFEFMPADVAQTLAPAVREVIGARQGGLLTFGILATLWFASNGFEALRTGLNRAYSVAEKRAIWWLRLQSIAFVVVGGLIILFLSLAVILGPLVWRRSVLRSTTSSRRGWCSSQCVTLMAALLLWGGLMSLSSLAAQYQADVCACVTRCVRDYGPLAHRGEPVRLVRRQPGRFCRLLRQPRRGRDHARVLLFQRDHLHLRRRVQRGLARANGASGRTPEGQR
jgi:YihY family inner membrane protein